MRKKIILGLGVAAIFVAYTIVLRNHNTKMQANLAANSSQGDNTSMTNGGTSNTYKDGTYTGASKNAYYGNVQVSITVSGGRITTVSVPQFPNSDPNSQDINSQAVPVLKQEAVRAQNAHVDMVSGATLTSQAFVQSLKSAIDKAKA